MTYFIANPKNNGRCIEVLEALTGEKKIIVEGTKCVRGDETGIYLTDRIPLSGIELFEFPAMTEGEKVLHYRSGRKETIKGTALLKTEEGWKDCVIYGNDEGMTFVREISDFMEAFVGIKEIED